MRSLPWLLVLFLMLAPGCGGGDKGDDGANCGDGTHEEEGECVPDDEADADARVRLDHREQHLRCRAA